MLTNILKNLGCCWWGRGALLTRNICNIGKINYFLGKRGAENGRSTLYPEIDFCRYPEIACTSAKGGTIRWMMGFFEWAERVERYRANGWNFEDQISQFVGDMTSDSFITGISRILQRGCHESGCSDIGEVRMLNRRKEHFFMIINDVFDLKSILAAPKPTTKPYQQFSRQPTRPIIQPTFVISPPAGIPTPPQQTNPTTMENQNVNPAILPPSQQQQPNPTQMENQNMNPGLPPPSQQETNPTQMENQNGNPSMSSPTQQQPNPSQMENQNMNPSPVMQTDETSPITVDGVPVRPIAQPGQPVSAPSKIPQPGLPWSNNGAVDEETSYYPTYGSGELIAIEGNATDMVSPKQVTCLMLLLVQFYYHIIL